MTTPAKFLLYLLFAFSLPVLAQKKLEYTKESKYWITYNDSIDRKIGVKDLKTTTDDFYFRLSYQGVKIDLWKDSLQQNQAALYHYTFRKYKNNPKETIVKKEDLPQPKADSLFDLIQKTHILDLPTDSEIKGWSHGFDGITYLIEYSDKERYTLKTYWTPRSQDSLQEAVMVQNFVDEAGKILHLREKKDVFTDDLPDGSYNDGGSTSMMKFQSENHYTNINIFGTYRLPLGLSVGYY